MRFVDLVDLSDLYVERKGPLKVFTKLNLPMKESLIGSHSSIFLLTLITRLSN